MNLAEVDARIVTAICFCMIGSIVIAFTAKVWWTHPVNRAFLFGPYLTQKGLRALLHGLFMLSLLGALAIAGGVSRFVYWLRWRNQASDELAAGVGLVEAALSLWATGSLIFFAVRTWREWRRL
jgi:uncharacterized membrane protein HdeD (DUF308 family)